MSGKRLSRQNIRRHRSYTIDETAKLLGVAKGTVRRWIAAGLLPALTDERPYLILGEDLCEFLAKRAPPRQKCRLDECFCFRCRRPSEPAFAAVEIELTDNTSGNLRALCATCATVMHKRIGLGKLDALSALVEVTITQRVNHIVDSSPACGNEHLEGAR
jgi:excisionase family DNA binding protein